ncbi:predicted protein [Phaeodactylum tricornutum CCAP 1055/1]|jgi:importin subunit beta-1|uniref:Importin N-terminal domain-containing protein n=3 Tax=Phaeodactylum tricornutum TaxID=2850 RepID=B7G8T5_PHATC|nr:predicted protein [Phaeodactylum tricornutum CCAP 1055/1]EEC45100.1 predicted protein [Phaeodactylum tricornutum CCAP 1055/1]|eukprot:XP_002183400.1 predicted protein [Phaeodactylum tricornutum CCAP 1055/1]
MADLTSILLAVASSPDRSEEKLLEEYMQSNYSEFCLALAKLLATEGAPFAARQMAALQLKNTVHAKSAEILQEKHNRWKATDATHRAAVKECLLAAMRSGVPKVPHFAAVTAAEFASIELPFNEWPQFIATLMENVTSHAPEPIKIASLECLGFTCESIVIMEELMGDNFVPELASSTVDTMLTTIVNGVQSNQTDAMRLVALTALKNSLGFVRHNMERKQERDFIFQAMCEATKSSDAQVRALAFACLDHTAELYYDTLPDYMTVIFELTTNAIRSNDEEETVQMNAMELWTAIASTEQTLVDQDQDAAERGQPLDRPPCPKYTLAAMEALVPLLLVMLAKQEDAPEDDSWGLQESAGVCLETISQTVEGSIVPHVIPFVTQHIQSEEWRYRDAAIVAFSSIMDGPSTEELAIYVNQSIPVLLRAFSDSNEMVRDSATHCISTVCRLHMIAVDRDIVHSIIKGLIEKLRDSPRVAAKACTALFNIATSFKSPEPEPTSLLSEPMLPLLQALLQTSERQDATECHLRVGAISAANDLVAAAPSDTTPILAEFLPVIIARYEATMHAQVLGNEEKEEKEQALGLFSSLISVLFQRLEKHDVLAYVDKVMELLLQGLQLRNASCHEEFWLAIGSIAGTMEGEFIKYMQALSPALLTSLRDFHAKTLCIVSIGVVVDICSAIGDKIQPYCDGIMSALVDCLKDSVIQRDVKPVVFSCFGDIAMSVGGAFQPYLQVSTMLLFQASQQQAPPDDEDLILFVNSLRLGILEAYSGIIMGLADGNALQSFTPSVPNIVQFVQVLAADSTKDIYVLEKSVALLGDVAQQMGSIPQIREQLNQHFVSKLLQEALNSNDETTVDSANWAGNLIKQLIRGNA